MIANIHLSPVIWGATCIFFASGSLLSASDNLDIYSTLDVCAEKADDINDIVSKLTVIGWKSIPKDEISDQTVRDLSWIYMGQNLLGEPSLAQITQQADLQKRTVRGFARKKDIPSAKTRILIKDVQKTSEAMIVNWVHIYPHVAWVECNLALKVSTPPEWSDQIANYLKVSPSEFPTFFSSPINFNEGSVKTQMTVYSINTQKLRNNSIPNATVSSAVKMSSTFPYNEVTP